MCVGKDDVSPVNVVLCEVGSDDKKIESSEDMDAEE